MPKLREMLRSERKGTRDSTKVNSRYKHTCLKKTTDPHLMLYGIRMAEPDPHF